MSALRGTPKWLTAGALLGASTLFSLGIVEIALRSTHRLETLFDPLRYEPELASEGWKRAFVRDYAQLQRRGRLGTDLAGYVHDPDLGWDTPNHVRGSREYPVEKRPGVFRVAVVGDSFTYGAEVGDEETYPRQLEVLLGKAEVLNLGVRAYGIDQMVLKYLKYGRAYRPDLLVVAIWTLDYLRTPLTFYRFAKPRYALHPETGALTLTHTPVPPPDQVYRRLQRELAPLSFTYAVLRQRYRLAVDPASDREPYYAKWDPLVRAILTRLVEVARADRTPVLFVLIEHGLELSSDGALGNRCCERKHLLDIFRGLSVDAIDLGEALAKRHSRRTVYERMYIHHGGIPSGHFTPLGNEASAREIGRYIQERFGVAVAGAN